MVSYSTRAGDCCQGVGPAVTRRDTALVGIRIIMLRVIDRHGSLESILFGKHEEKIGLMLSVSLMSGRSTALERFRRMLSCCNMDPLR